MKKPVALVLVVLLAFASSSCSIIRNRIANSIKAVRSAAAEFSLSPDWTEESSEGTEAPENMDKPVSTETERADEPGDQPEDTATPEDTAEPEATIATGEEFSAWPQGLPYGIPEFTYGSLQKDQSFKAESNDTATYSMQFTGVEKADLEVYGKALKEAGLTVESTEDSGAYSVVGMIQKDYVPVAMVSAYLIKDSGACAVVVMLYLSEDDSGNS